MPDNKNKNLDQDKKQQQQPMKQGGSEREVQKDDLDLEDKEESEITQRNPRQGGAMPKKDGE